MACSRKHCALVIKEFINNSGSPILTQRVFCIQFILGRHDPISDHKTIQNWVSYYRQTNSALKFNKNMVDLRP